VNSSLNLFKAATNAGSMTLVSGVLALNGTAAIFTNNGFVNLEGAPISGSGMFSNSAGGVIAGNGAIASNFANSSGLLIVTGYTTVTRAFSNGGEIQLGGVTASLTGG